MSKAKTDEQLKELASKTKQIIRKKGLGDLPIKVRAGFAGGEYSVELFRLRGKQAHTTMVFKSTSFKDLLDRIGELVACMANNK